MPIKTDEGKVGAGAAQQQPEQVTHAGGRSGRALKWEKTTDSKGVVYYEADLDWRKSEN